MDKDSRPSSKEIRTTEGFRLYGVNKTEDIVRLGKRASATLDGEFISTIESQIQASPTNLHANLLGEGERLIPRLAEDNKTVVEELKLTHQELAEFPKAARAALRGRDETDIDYNNKRFRTWKKYVGGIYHSPFRDHSSTGHFYQAICLDDGTGIGFLGIFPDMIDMVGFYGGVGRRSYRTDPLKLAKAAGLAEIPEDDPVRQFVKDQSQHYVLTNTDQLNRLVNLISLRPTLTDKMDLTIDFQTIEELIDAITSIQDVIQDKDVADIVRARLSHMVDVNGLSAEQRLSVNSLSYLIRRGPALFPELAHQILEQAESIGIRVKDPQHEINELRNVLSTLIGSIGDTTKDGRTNEHKDFYQGMLQKLYHADPTLSYFLFHEAGQLLEPKYTSAPPAPSEKVAALADSLTSVLPTLTKDTKEALAELGVPTPETATIEQLLTSYQSIQETEKMVRAARHYIVHVGHIEKPSGRDIRSLYAVIDRFKNDAFSEITPQEAAALTRLNVDPSLIPYALRAIPSRRSSLDNLVAALYNGSAENQKHYEEITARLSELPQPMHDITQTLIGFVMQQKYFSGFPIDQFVERIVSMTEKGQPTERDVLSEFVALRYPELKALVETDYVSIKIDKEASQKGTAALIVQFDKEKLSTIPSVSDVMLPSQTKKVFTVGDYTYTIDDRFFELRVKGGKGYLLKGTELMLH